MNRYYISLLYIALIVLALLLPLNGRFDPPPAAAQSEPADAGALLTPETREGNLQAPDQVEVEPTARDEEIAERLTSILRSTEWFVAPSVRVREGVVFLNGRTQREEYREWAGTLARNTQDVVAVVNRIELIEQSPWDFTPAFNELSRLGGSTVQTLPLILFGAAVLALTWILARSTSRIARRLLQGQIPNAFLRNLVAALLGMPVLLLGLYLVLQVAGLTRLALTVLGGTGLAGLIIGIAFQDIAENFLASILISTHSPFAIGDRIEVLGYTGIVQQVTTRGTVLMTIEGNHVRIPNATIYKSNIVNYSANPNSLLEINVGIGYEDSIAEAQELLRELLLDHRAILTQPEPRVLADSLGPASIGLRVLFWIDERRHNRFTVKSSVIRLIKNALDQNGFTLPDEAREVIFPNGVPIWTPDEQSKNRYTSKQIRTSQLTPKLPPVATPAEGDLSSEDAELQKQAQEARSLNEGEDLLQIND